MSCLYLLSYTDKKGVLLVVLSWFGTSLVWAATYNSVTAKWFPDLKEIYMVGQELVI